MEMQEFLKRLLFLGSVIYSTSITPLFNYKYIHLYQGGELFNNPDVKKLLCSFGYIPHPTGDDTSYHNGTVRQAPRTLSNSIGAILTVANLYIKIFHMPCTILSEFPIPFQNLIQLIILLRNIHTSNRTSTPFLPFYLISM